MADTNHNPASRAPRYEVRAVWTDAYSGLVSQRAEAFDVIPMKSGTPDKWGVYEIYRGHVEDHATRDAAAKHAAELNGGERS